MSLVMEVPTSPKAQAVLKKLEALRKLAQDLGINTNRTQRGLIKTLNEQELGEVAACLDALMLLGGGQPVGTLSPEVARIVRTSEVK